VDVVLVDTGPLVALLDPSDRQRARIRAAFGALDRAELVTTEAVVTEVSYLLDFSVEAQAALQTLLAAGRPRVVPIEQDERRALAEMMTKYRSLPMDYADATLVQLATRLGTMRVLTLDRRDFNVYRVRRRGFQILPR
jgi:predicted nucleic acid-binding protein